MKTPMFAVALCLIFAACTSGQAEPIETKPDVTDASGFGDVANAACVQWCKTRAPKEANDGWCPLDPTVAGDCAQVCSARIENERADALQTCVETDPLCFVTLDQCLTSAAAAIDCGAWCQYRVDTHANDGFCEPWLTGSPASGCFDVCVTALASALTSENVQACVQDDPLCFVDVNSCAS